MYINRHCRQCLLLAYYGSQLHRDTIHLSLNSAIRLSVCSIDCLFSSGFMLPVLPRTVIYKYSSPGAFSGNQSSKPSTISLPLTISELDPLLCSGLHSAAVRTSSAVPIIVAIL